jgi:hypothetical protein
MVSYPSDKLKHSKKTKTDKATRVIRVAILAEEPITWGSGKDFFPVILDDYQWIAKDKIYKFSTEFVYDKDIIKGRVSTSSFDVILVPGGGVGDGEAIVKGFNLWPRVRKWKKKLSGFIKDGGGYVGICGGAALITNLQTENSHPITFTERQYHKSALDVSCVTSYYKCLAIPLFYLFQRNHPEKIGATGYVFSFAPGETQSGIQAYFGGVPIDFQLSRDHPICSGFTKNIERIRWWGGPALIVPNDVKRDINILARYPKIDPSKSDLTKIYAWRYVGGIHGLLVGLIKALRLIKKRRYSLRNLFTFAYYLAGDWECSDKTIDLDFSNKVCMTAEVYPNESKGRIVLCAAHPEYMIWRGGKIEEVEKAGFHCLATGLHRWKNIRPLSNDGFDELTHTWWMVRRFVAWAAKVPDTHLPPILKGEKTENVKRILSEINYDRDIINQMKNI